MTAVCDCSCCDSDGCHPVSQGTAQSASCDDCKYACDQAFTACQPACLGGAGTCSASCGGAGAAETCSIGQTGCNGAHPACTCLGFVSKCSQADGNCVAAASGAPRSLGSRRPSTWPANPAGVDSRALWIWSRVHAMHTSQHAPVVAGVLVVVLAAVCLIIATSYYCYVVKQRNDKVRSL
jgi:hypothetical protein